MGPQPWILLSLVVAVLALLFDLRRVEGSSRSVEGAYDSNKGVFSPQGRLVQLDYVEGLVKRGNLCMGAECKDGVVLLSNKLVSADAGKLLVDGGVRRIYRVDSHVGILPAGLPADGRALAHKAMDYCRSHRREYGEPIPGRLLAERLGEFIHAACVRWGSRAYPNALFVACWEDGTPDDTPDVLRSDGRSGGGGGDAGIADTPGGASTPKARATAEPAPGVNAQDDGETEEEVEEGEETAGTGRDAGFQLFVVDPSGAVRRHRAACEGRGSSRARGWLRRRTAAPGAPPSEDSIGTVIGGDGDTTASNPEEEEEEEEEEEGSELSLSGVSSFEVREGREDGSEESAEEGGRRRQVPLSQMTCAEAARAMVGEARSIREGEFGAGGSGDVASVPEVAWLSIDRRKGRRGGEEPVFVHHRSVEDLFESER